ncbi:hypothetical protein POM88_018686 [Heracleum sosnowskyi]|uniref:Uncharacterized protein n=1 Tax=Heracleum sosnowskyi TaxID=360622 RepID=A0AAD8IT03_9APIA|nr:hypothetical protein POM88_018686 [Heracleum sosnowskyi]
MSQINYVTKKSNMQSISQSHKGKQHANYLSKSQSKVTCKLSLRVTKESYMQTISPSHKAKQHANYLTKEPCHKAKQHANYLSKFQSLTDDEVFSVINVYSAQDPVSKRTLWAVLANITANQQSECLYFIGDINSIRDDSERANCSYRRIDIDGFNHFIDNSNLQELALVNSEFTWFGPGGKRSKLDRALVNSVWWSKGHWLLMVSHQVHNWGPVPFKIFNCWMKDAELAKIINTQINKDVQSGSLDLRMIVRIVEYQSRSGPNQSIRR